MSQAVTKIESITDEDGNTITADEICSELFSRIFGSELQLAISELQVLQSKSAEEGFKVTHPKDFTHWQRTFIRQLIRDVEGSVQDHIREMTEEEESE